MQFQFIALDETKSQTKVHGNIYLFDFWFILIYFAVSGMLGNVVSDTLRIPYYIFSVFAALWFTSKSRSNKRRRNYEAMILFLRRDNVQGDVLQRNIGRVPQQIFGHVDSGAVMGDHLLDKTA